MPAVYITLCIVSGVLAGVRLRGRKRIIAWVDHLALASVLALVWLLGASIGANSEVMNRLGTLGLEAVVIAFAAMIGSVVLVEVVHRLWFAEDVHEG